jgi:hypothetical protein
MDPMEQPCATVLHFEPERIGLSIRHTISKTRTFFGCSGKCDRVRNGNAPEPYLKHVPDQRVRIVARRINSAPGD